MPERTASHAERVKFAEKKDPNEYVTPDNVLNVAKWGARRIGQVPDHLWNFEERVGWCLLYLWQYCLGSPKVAAAYSCRSKFRRYFNMQKRKPLPVRGLTHTVNEPYQHLRVPVYAKNPGPKIVDLADEFAHWYEEQKRQEQAVINLRALHFNNIEIAKKLGTTHQNVSRILAKLRNDFNQRLGRQSNRSSRETTHGRKRETSHQKQVEQSENLDPQEYVTPQNVLDVARMTVSKLPYYGNNTNYTSYDDRLSWCYEQIWKYYLGWHIKAAISTARKAFITHIKAECRQNASPQARVHSVSVNGEEHLGLEKGDTNENIGENIEPYNFEQWLQSTNLNTKEKAVIILRQKGYEDYQIAAKLEISRQRVQQIRTDLREDFYRSREEQLATV